MYECATNGPGRARAADGGGQLAARLRELASIRIIECSESGAGPEQPGAAHDLSGRPCKLRMQVASESPPIHVIDYFPSHVIGCFPRRVIDCFPRVVKSTVFHRRFNCQGQTVVSNIQPGMRQPCVRWNGRFVRVAGNCQ